MRRIIVDFDDDIQNLRDPETGQYVELEALIGMTIVDVTRGEDDQLIFEFDGDWPAEED